MLSSESDREIIVYNVNLYYTITCEKYCDMASHSRCCFFTGWPGDRFGNLGGLCDLIFVKLFDGTLSRKMFHFVQRWIFVAFCSWYYPCKLTLVCTLSRKKCESVTKCEKYCEKTLHSRFLSNSDIISVKHCGVPDVCKVHVFSTWM